VFFGKQNVRLKKPIHKVGYRTRLKRFALQKKVEYNDSYRSYYLEAATKQIGVALTMIWNGVILNKGHHSHWKKK
jgi:hypothetical protein